MRTLLLILTTCLLALPANAKYSGGSGTAADPYQIATAADLIALGETSADYDKHFLLTADIDLDPHLPGRKVFDKAVIAPKSGDDIVNPPGTDFTGSLDGKGHAIRNLTISGGTGGYLGLFGRVWNGGRIRNLCLENADITGARGSSCLGTLAGASDEGIIDSCYAIGSVVGGEESEEIGGLVGHNRGSITNCCAGGSVFAGKNSKCTGGLVGSAFLGSVTAYFCFWDTQTSGQAASVGGTGKTTTEMHKAKTFLDAGWDFVGETVNGTADLWRIDEGKDYPRLWWELIPAK